jgi:hypothetical protein
MPSSVKADLLDDGIVDTLVSVGATRLDNAAADSTDPHKRIHSHRLEYTVRPVKKTPSVPVTPVRARYVLSSARLAASPDASPFQDKPYQTRSGAYQFGAFKREGESIGRWCRRYFGIGRRDDRRSHFPLSSMPERT